MNLNQRENIDRDPEFLRAGQMTQHLYPRIAINPPGPDGEIMVTLIHGLPCCGTDLKLECPAGTTVEDLGKIIRKFFEFNQDVAALPTFSVCQIPVKL